MREIKRIHIKEQEIIEGMRLGRHVHHDPLSKHYPAAMAPAEMLHKLTELRHERRVPVFNQGALGSCTGNAAVGCISTDPYTFRGTEEDAVSVYSDATKIDNYGGEYPPDDTGSSGLAVMQVLKSRALIAGYTHSFGLEHTLRTLILKPGITGIHWKTDMDRPDPVTGEVNFSGDIRGGHEVEIAGFQVLPKRLVWFWNSWGPEFGLGGLFCMSWDDFAAALAEHGDATFPR